MANIANWKDPPCYEWENSVFQWPFSIAAIAMLNYQMVYEVPVVVLGFSYFLILFCHMLLETATFFFRFKQLAKGSVLSYPEATANVTKVPTTGPSMQLDYVGLSFFLYVAAQI